MPRRVVLVSRNPGLGFGLESIGWEVVEVRDRELDQLTGPQDTGDALVLDLRDPDRASSILADLRSRGIDTPVLLVAGSGPGWASVAASELASTLILELPASRERLQSALDQLVGLVNTAPPPPGPQPAMLPEADEPQPTSRARARGRHAAVPAPSTAPEQVGEPASQSAALQLTETATAAVGPPPGASGVEAAEDLSRLPELVEEGEVDDVADGALARALAGQHITAPPAATRPRGFPPRPAAPSAPAAPAEPVAETGRATTPSPSSHGDLAGLVDALAARADELYSVSETGQVVAEQALETVAADASVVFVPDDGGWRVAGEVGLRPLERRAVLPRDAWLVNVVALSHRGVVVEDSDIARSRLGGVPLAHQAHLLAVPVPAVDGLVLLARVAEPAFTQDDVAALARLSGEAGALLHAAVRARALARGLSRLVDRPDAHR